MIQCSVVMLVLSVTAGATAQTAEFSVTAGGEVSVGAGGVLTIGNLAGTSGATATAGAGTITEQATTPPSSPPTHPPPLSPSPAAPPLGPFGGIDPVNTCMTYTNEVQGRLKVTAAENRWDFANGQCSGTLGPVRSPMPCLNDGDTSTACDTGLDTPTYYQPFHDDVVAYDFGRSVSFNEMAIWGTECGMISYGVSDDGATWRACGALRAGVLIGGSPQSAAAASMKSTLDRHGITCTSPGASTPVWINLGNHTTDSGTIYGTQTARYIAVTSGSGNSNIYELAVRMSST